jgi:hypothetical protein
VLEALDSRWDSIASNPVINIAALCDVRTKSLGFLAAGDRATVAAEFEAEVVRTAEASLVAAAAVPAAAPPAPAAQHAPAGPRWAVPVPIAAAAPADPAAALRASVRAEVQRYLQEPQLGLDADPLHWWRQNQQLFPSVAHVARKYLNLPASSAASERVFSAGKLIMSRGRQRMSPRTLIETVWLRQNRKLCQTAWYNM